MKYYWEKKTLKGKKREKDFSKSFDAIQLGIIIDEIPSQTVRNSRQDYVSIEHYGHPR